MTQQILQFTQDHWMLCTSFITILGILIFEEIKNKLSGIPRVLAKSAVLMLNRENALAIDLRSKAAFAGGHILGSISIVRAEIDQDLKKLEPHKDRPLILVDDQDSGAVAVGSKLQKAGFTKVYILAGGPNSWQDAQLPLSKTSTHTHN